MDAPPEAIVRRVVAALAELSPAPETPDSGHVVPLEWFRCMPLLARPLLAGYLPKVDSPAGRPVPGEPVSPSTATIVADLAMAGVATVAGYPAGRHTVDIAVATAGHARPRVGSECAVHAADTEAHVDRHLDLVLGWDIREAFPSKWSERTGELVVSLPVDLGSRAAPHVGDSSERTGR